jgi:acyl-CoA thioester hydrolase
MQIEIIRQLPVIRQGELAAEAFDPLGRLPSNEYFAWFSSGAWDFFASIGLDAEYFQTAQCGIFALALHITYYHQPEPDEPIAIHARMLDYGTKRIHWMGIMVSQAHDRVLATVEGLDSHADLVARRTAPFPPQITARIAELQAAHAHLTLDLPLCGVLKA